MGYSNNTFRTKPWGLIAILVFLASSCTSAPNAPREVALSGPPSPPSRGDEVPTTGSRTETPPAEAASSGDDLRVDEASMGTASTSDEATPSLRTIVAAMTLREKLTQRFIVWIPRNSDAATVEELRRLQPAGYILFPWNYKSADEARALTAELSRSQAPVGGAVIAPLICADMEGGRVAAFRFPEFPSIPSAFTLGSSKDTRLIEAAGGMIGAIMANLGCNMDLAPVTDLYPKADSTIIGDRSFGPDPIDTGLAASAFAKGLASQNIIATLKHFPGHGITTVDSHGQLPVVNATEEELWANHLRPFATAIQNGAPVVMTAHILYPAIDAENPATLSKTILQDILRGELGFKGVILSDGFEMGALAKNYGRAESLARAFDAGVDLILLYSHYAPEELIGVAEELVKSGRISEKSVDESVMRILQVKSDYGLISSAQ